MFWVPEVGKTADTPNPLGYYPFKEICLVKCPTPPLLAFPREKWEKGKRQQEGES